MPPNANTTDNGAASPLAQPFTLRCGVVFPGRIVKAAMTEGLADDWSNPSEAYFNLYSTWSKNQNAGHVLITGNVQVDRRYMERPGNIAIEIECKDKEARMAALKRLAEAAQQDGTLCMVQLSHAGRQSSIQVNKETIAPSAVKPDTLMGMPMPEPRAMTQEDIDDVVARFANAALVCKEAGFLGGIELHGAHGYLLSQFLSPRANLRTDAYGGSLENRSLLLLQVYRACRAAVGPNYPIAVKLNSSDFQKGGFSNEDAVEVAKMLEREGVDLLELSGGSYENVAMMYGPGGLQKNKKGTTLAREGYFLEFTAKIRAELKTLPVMVTGGFRTKARMERALAEQDCDFIGIARPVVGAPDCVARMLRGETDSLPSFESTLRVHWSLRWLDWFATGKFLQLGVLQIWLLINLQRLSKNQTPITQLTMGILKDFKKIDAAQTATARNMLGMDGIVGTVLNNPKA